MTNTTLKSPSQCIYISLDDTDMIGTRGTGRLARDIAATLEKDYRLGAVTRHQLFVHPSIPYTSHNSAAVIHIETEKNFSPKDIFNQVKEIMLDEFIEGSDPGLAVALSTQITPSLIIFGQDAKNQVLTVERAKKVSENAGIFLEELGGTGQGIIGATAAVGLAASGSDGRVLHFNKIRKYTGITEVSVLKGSGINEIYTLDGTPVKEGFVTIPKTPHPSWIMGRPILFVEKEGDDYIALKRD